MRPLISLVMIAKDEAKSIQKTLESVIPFVERWTILLDNRTTDDTYEIIVDAMSDKPGAIEILEFENFEQARNVGLGCAAVNDDALFTLMLSGDEVLQNGAELRAFLESKRDAPEGAYGVTMKAGAQSWPYMRILRNGGGWKYQGAVQEIPVGPNGETVGPLSPGVVVHTVTDPLRRSKRIREFDLPTLTKMVEDETLSEGARAHSLFHLAECHAALAAESPDGERLTHQMAAMGYYWRYGQIAEQSEGGAYDQKKAVYAYFYYFHVADKVGLYSPSELSPRLEALVEADPALPEARFLLAKCAAQIDVRKGLFFAEEAARVAREWQEHPGHLPSDSRIEWMALCIAADCAKAQKQLDRYQAFKSKAVEAGCPEEAFES